jgi:hypothetical protein
MITNDVPDTVVELFDRWIKDEVGSMNAAFYYGALRQGFIAGYKAGHADAWDQWRKGKLFENDDDAKQAYEEALNNKPEEDNDD